MKKFYLIAIAVIMSAIFCLGLSACNNNPDDNNKKPEPDPIVCEHTSHNATTKICPDCKQVVDHHYISGKCTLCESTTEFMWEIIKKDTSLMQTLKQGIEHKGTVETITYETHAYNLEAIQEKNDIIIEKEAYVYLPYGYDPANQYDVLILLHGTGETAGYWFGEGGYDKTNDKSGYYATGCLTTELLDWMIDEGKAKPTIVVTPCFYDNSAEQFYENNVVMSLYGKEVVNSILPAVVEKYSTYAEGSTSEELIAARDHFAFAGLSRGSAISFDSVATDFLPYFAYFGSYSAGAADPENIVSKLNNEFKDYDIKYWLMGCGSLDKLGEGHHKTFDTLVNGCDRLTNLENCAFIDIYGAQHTYECWITCLYNSMLKFFQM